MEPNLGDPSTKKFTTGRLYWLPAGAVDGHIDFGNMPDYKYEPKVDRLDHMSARRGRAHADFSYIKSHAQKKSFTFDEQFNETIKLLALSTQGQNIVQVAAGGQRGFVLSPFVAGRVYDLGIQGLINPQVTCYVQFSGVPNDFVILAVDPSQYALHSGSGMITLYGPFNITVTYGPHTGEVWPISQFEVLADLPLITQLNFTGLNNLLSRGKFKLVESDQFEDVPYGVETFAGQCEVTAWGENKTDKFEEFTLEVLITDR